MIRTIPRPRWPDLLTDVVRWLLSPKLDSLGASRRAPARATPAGAGVGNRVPARAGALDGHNLRSFGWDPAASTTATPAARASLMKLRAESGSRHAVLIATSSAPAPAPPATTARPDRISMTITVGYGGLAPERQCKSATTWEPVRFAISVRGRPRTERPSLPYPLRTPVGRHSQSFVRRCHEESTERNTRDGRPD